MDNYYIKNIWGPSGQEGYGNKIIGFDEKQKKAAQRFSKCDGFFLYETGNKDNNKIGAKTIFAQGIIKMPPRITFCQYEQKCKAEYGNEKRFCHHVEINLSKRINPLNGIPLDTIRTVLKSPKEHMQRQGGLIKITKDQFEKLSDYLQKIEK